MNYRNAIVSIVMTGTLTISAMLSSAPAFADTAAVSSAGIASSSASSAQGSATAPSTANAKISQDEAAAIVKAVLPVPNNAPSYASLQSDFGPMSENHHPVWNLGWQLGQPGEKTVGNINATVDAVTGTLLNFNQWSQAEQQSTFPPKISQDQAAAIGLSLIRKLQPETSQSVRKIAYPVVTNQGSLRGPFLYNLTFQRVVNGIPVPSDTFQIGVDGNGTITSYNFHWSNIPSSAFPDAKQVIDVSKAQNTYNHDLNMRLAYQPFYEPFKQNGPDIHLVYQPGMSYNQLLQPGPYAGSAASYPLWIDAKTDDWIDNTGKPVNPAAGSQTIQVIDPSGQDSNPPTLQQPLTADQALQIAKKYAGVDDSYSMNQSMNDYNGTKTYSFNWYKNSQPPQGPSMNVNVTIDAQTGQLLNFNRWNPAFGPGQKPPATVISEDAARQKAVDFIKQVLPNKTRALYFMPAPKFIGKFIGKGSNSQHPVQYNFSFGELVNGIPSDMNTVNIAVNAATGEIENYFHNTFANAAGGKVSYPDPSHVIPADQAKAEFAKSNPLELEYVQPMNADGTGPSDHFMLVYAPHATKPGEVLDAVSGAWVSPYGQSVSDQTQQATDIQGHWAEKQLQMMIDRGILQVVNGKVHPDSAITKGDLIRMLILAIGVPLQMNPNQAATFSDVQSGSKYFPYVEAAVNNHWISKGAQFNPNDNVTREELAELLTRALGYEDLAKYSSIFQVPFADKNQIANDFIGDVAIVDGLGIMKGSDNAFHPKQETTVAQAVVAIVKTVEIMNHKSASGPIYYIKNLQKKIEKMKR
ncbi:S-layer homology domain-containing protein [Fodinisporobacter ferrooxydans]|uniref:S-layer homology domain-containing protein n=1 Tax=Fodinisporobacter ferrooxydans TaxID=2901836 RepID=A0ABY4CXR0_9BACL|nr:S-layer homology domain-containing protein [Alicyclobacillaceae bacterium MYW30-H2]